MADMRLSEDSGVGYVGGFGGGADKNVVCVEILKKRRPFKDRHLMIEKNAHES